MDAAERCNILSATRSQSPLPAHIFCRAVMQLQQQPVRVRVRVPLQLQLSKVSYTVPLTAHNKSPDITASRGRASSKFWSSTGNKVRQFPGPPSDVEVHWAGRRRSGGINLRTAGESPQKISPSPEPQEGHPERCSLNKLAK